jgi:hypothetical protein
MSELGGEVAALSGVQARLFVLLVVEHNLPLLDVVQARHGGGYLEYVAPYVGDWWSELLEDTPLAPERAKAYENSVMHLIMDNNDFFHEDKRCQAVGALLDVLHAFAMTRSKGREPSWQLRDIVDQLSTLAEIVGPKAAPDRYVPALVAKARTFDGDVATARTARDEVRRTRPWTTKSVTALRNKLR